MKMKPLPSRRIEATGTASPDMRRHAVRAAGTAKLQNTARFLIFTLSVALIAVVGFELVRNFNYDTLSSALRHTHGSAIALSAGATASSFLILIIRDVTALRYAQSRASGLAIFLAAFCGVSLSNAAGLGGLSGAAVRYRIYGAAGVRPDAVARIIVFIAGGSAAGIALSCGLAAYLAAHDISGSIHWPPVAIRIASIALVCTPAALIFACKGRSFQLGGVAMAFPQLGLAAAQIAITMFDLGVSAAALWFLLPASSLSLTSFVPIFVLAVALGGISHVPGGLGVFEAVILIALNGHVPADTTAAALLLYRAVYYVMPLFLSAGLLAGFEVRRLNESGTGGLAQRQFANSAARLSPLFLAVLTFFAGLMLIASGEMPAAGHRVTLLAFHLPLWLRQTSHFLGSLEGVLLLFIARGLFHRLDGAWLLAMVLTVGGLMLSLAKGFCYTEATILMALCLLLAMTRRQFSRRSSLLGQTFTLSWFIAAGSVAAGLIWILAFVARNIDSGHDLWWEVEANGAAPGSVRIMLGLSLVAMAIGLTHLLRVTNGSVKPATAVDLSRAASIVARHDRGDAALVMMGDKSILFSASGKAFLMFARRGRSWVTLLDPVGPRPEWPELIWRFAELAGAHGGRAAFYQIRPESLPFYIETGLRIIKIGEEARIDLAAFSLDGPRRTNLRYALKRGARDGLSFTFVPAGQALPLIPTLESISAEWLARRGRREKRFSVAAFDPDFVEAQTIALVSQNGRPVAFASVMTTQTRQEAVLGLMRHVNELSPYAMEYLFANLILTLKAEGYQDFSLGVAPLSGLSDLPFAAVWYRLGNLIWKHGNILYNFQGVRLFKNKFDPVWEPRYLAVPGLLGPLFALADVAALTSAPAKE